MIVVESITQEHATVLKQGYPVRMAAPELGGDIIIILAATGESTEQVLRESLDDLQTRHAWATEGLRVAAKRAADDQ